MFWFKKLKQQSYYKDENERELAELKVDGVTIKDESDDGAINAIARNRKTRYNMSESD